MNAYSNDSSSFAFHSSTYVEDLFQEDACQLWMSKWESPKTEIRGGIWDSTKHELNGLDKLMDEYFWEICVRRGLVFLLKDLNYLFVFLASCNSFSFWNLFVLDWSSMNFNMSTVMFFLWAVLNDKWPCA